MVTQHHDLSPDPWPDAATERLKHLSAEGWSLGAIAQKMSRSRAAIDGKLKRLGLRVTAQERIKALAGMIAQGMPVPSAAIASWPIEHQITFKRLVRSAAAPTVAGASRPGQASFRAEILANFGGRCCITSCNEPEVIDAAHIVPYGAVADHSVANGLALRVDLHRLFDAGLIGIDPVAGTCLVAPALSDPLYRALSGAPTTLRTANVEPSRAGLRWHLENQFRGDWRACAQARGPLISLEK